MASRAGVQTPPITPVRRIQNPPVLHRVANGADTKPRLQAARMDTVTPVQTQRVRHTRLQIVWRKAVNGVNTKQRLQPDLMDTVAPVQTQCVQFTHQQIVRRKTANGARILMGYLAGVQLATRAISALFIPKRTVKRQAKSGVFRRVLHHQAVGVQPPVHIPALPQRRTLLLLQRRQALPQAPQRPLPRKHKHVLVVANGA